jgi:hypothetical protein
MKPLYATLFAAALLLCTKPALAADNALDMSELTCEQFMNYNDDNKGLIMMWFEGNDNYSRKSAIKSPLV